MSTNDPIIRYVEYFGLKEAELQLIEHEDTIISEVYRVLRVGKPPLILKLFPNNQDYYRECHFLSCLADSLPVPKLVDCVEPLPSRRGAILMDCLEGNLVRPEDWTEPLAYQVGGVLAKIHLKHTEGYGDLCKTQELASSAAEYFGQKFFEELNECVSHLPEQTIQQVREYFATHRYLLDSVDGPCIIHRDFRPGNMIVHKGKLSGVIDWAGARSGFAEQDFCSMEYGNWPSRSNHRQALLLGYSSVRPLPNYHRIMPLLRLGRALAVIGFTLRTDTWQGKNERLYAYNRRFLRGFPFQ